MWTWGKPREPQTPPWGELWDEAILEDRREFGTFERHMILVSHGRTWRFRRFILSGKDFLKQDWDLFYAIREAGKSINQPGRGREMAIRRLGELQETEPWKYR